MVTNAMDNQVIVKYKLKAFALLRKSDILSCGHLSNGLQDKSNKRSMFL